MPTEDQIIFDDFSCPVKKKINCLPLEYPEVDGADAADAVRRFFLGDGSTESVEYKRLRGAAE